MVLIRFTAIADLDVPEGKDNEFYALAMKDHIEKTSLDEIDYKTEVYPW